MVVAITSQCNYFISHHLHPPHHNLPTFSSQNHPFSCCSAPITEKARLKSTNHKSVISPVLSSDENPLGIFEKIGAKEVDSGLKSTLSNNKQKKRRVFFLDVNPLCYHKNVPCLRSFAHWISLFFDQVSLSDPVIAVIDGENGNDYRRQLMPSYKAHRRKPADKMSVMGGRQKYPVERSHRLVLEVLHKCNVPVVKVEGYEADDVIATLVEQALNKGYNVVVASPDKDFKQLLSDDVQIVMPIPEYHRWSFYTVKHYAAQFNCDPQSDLSLRCIIGDEVDGVPGIQHLVPGFGRKTALKLLRKHGSLENLLNAAAVRTVGRQYAQEALTTYADCLRKNFQVLSLNRNVDVQLEEKWMSRRDSQNDSVVITNFIHSLSQKQNHNLQKGLGNAC